ncbi:MAG TPA: hypothetical protein VFH73_21730 [Polyangia bacterium]|nr:hypothetical protein [Polyangia bacterium]
MTLVALIVLVQTTAGCLSNEYRIPSTELQRLAALPPEARGQHVRVIQALGERRSPALGSTEHELPPAPPPEDAATEWEQPPTFDSNAPVNVDVQVMLSGQRKQVGVGRGPRPVGDGGGTRTASGWRGSPPGSSGSGFRGTPPPSGGGGVGGGGGGRFSPPGGGSSGGDHPEALVVLAVIVVALAAVASVFLVASEGMRFDGFAELDPEQTLYLKTDRGEDKIVTLSTLSVQDAASAEEALVKDDEGFGLRELDAVPLNRKGMAFKMDLGTSAFSLGQYSVNGLASHIQLGYFPTQTFGLMVDATLSGAGVTDIIAGDVGQVPEGTLIRHSLALELQAFPLAVGRFHLGLFGKGGVAVIGPASSPETGPVAGGGALIEIGVTSRLALTLRGGLDAARLDSGWSRAGVLTAGVSIY